jgi:cobalt-zinc-cadmium efflux system protein
MSHDHHHNHSHISINLNRAFYIGIGLNFLFVLIEAAVGFYIHSLSLLSDAGHNLADVVSLALSLLAYKLSTIKPNDKYTYGYRKTSILVALFNSVVLLISIGAIGFEAIHRFLNPEPLPGITIAAVAAIGIVINTITALMFIRDKERDLNVKSAYLHLLSDAMVSLALVVGGIAIYYTHWYWIDPLLCIIVVGVILVSTLGLLRSSLRLSLDAVPENVDLEKIRSTITQIGGVKDIHHIHAWGVGTTANALTAHIVVKDNATMNDLEKIKKDIKHELEHLNIQHATLEFEPYTGECKEESF